MTQHLHPHVGVRVRVRVGVRVGVRIRVRVRVRVSVLPFRHHECRDHHSGPALASLTVYGHHVAGVGVEPPLGTLAEGCHTDERGRVVIEAPVL